MYSKREISKQREAFWTAFGKYMLPVLSADGEKINWVNYKTGIPGVSFKMNADNNSARIAIVSSHNDSALRKVTYEQLQHLKDILHSILGEEWLWQPDVQDEYGKEVSMVSKELPDVNINRTEDWPRLISFFKPRIIALDEFWSTARYSFE
jgi:hypothetical protein